eukprot:7039506-Ditylum_brightwellii.AAC.1
MTVKEVHKFGLIVQCPDDNIGAKAALKKAQSKVREIICKAAETRLQHNKTIAQIHSLTNEKNAEQAIKAIMYAETMSNMWKKIGYADTWPDMSTPLLADDELENPKTAFTWCKVDPPEEILHYLT